MRIILVLGLITVLLFAFGGYSSAGFSEERVSLTQSVEKTSEENTAFFSQALSVEEHRRLLSTVSGEADICAQPLDVMLVIDTSGSMWGDRILSAKSAASVFVDTLDESEDKVGLVSFTYEAVLRSPLTLTHSDVKEAINSLNAGGGTDIGIGITRAQKEISDNGVEGSLPIMILLSDGMSHSGVFEATAAKNEGTIIYAVGLGIAVGSEWETKLIEIASDPDFYFSAPTSADLAEVYSLLADILNCSTCGDGILDPDEECDDGNRRTESCLHGERSCEVCNAFCLLEPGETSFCGDGDLDEEFELCDDGNDINDDACNNGCGFNFCGNRNIDEAVGEECDDGRDGDQEDECTDRCNIPACGDGFTQETLGEECDDFMDGDQEDECTDLCRSPTCGDGFRQISLEEDCDDSKNGDNDDGCTDICRFPFCGDGFPQPSLGEECDDGDLDNINDCRNNCKINVCGNAIIDEAVEQCDDGARVSGDGCSNICEIDSLCSYWSVDSGDIGPPVVNGLFEGEIGTSNDKFFRIEEILSDNSFLVSVGDNATGIFNVESVPVLKGVTNSIDTLTFVRGWRP